MARKVGVYTRISRDDEGESLGVARQQQDCERLADLRSWQVVKTYEDNDVSAFKRNVVRGEFELMLRDLRLSASSTPSCPTTWTASPDSRGTWNVSSRSSTSAPAWSSPPSPTTSTSDRRTAARWPASWWRSPTSRRTMRHAGSNASTSSWPNRARTAADRRLTAGGRTTARRSIR